MPFRSNHPYFQKRIPAWQWPWVWATVCQKCSCRAMYFCAAFPHYSSDMSDMYENQKYQQSDNVLSVTTTNICWSYIILIFLSHAILLCLGAGPSRTYGHAWFGLARIQEADKPLWRRHSFASLSGSGQQVWGLWGKMSKCVHKSGQVGFAGWMGFCRSVTQWHPSLHLGFGYTTLGEATN